MTKIASIVFQVILVSIITYRIILHFRVDFFVDSMAIGVTFFRYEEDKLKVGRKKKNLMFIGDGKGNTVITGGQSVADKLTTFHTASFGKLLFSHSCRYSFVVVVVLRN